VSYQKGKYFGDELTPREREVFANDYKSQLRGIVDQVHPWEKNHGVVQFKGDWLDEEGAPEVMRHIKKWDVGELKSEECWLAQEDLWVQRELLRLVRVANDYVAKYHQEVTATEVRVDRRPGNPAVSYPDDDTHLLGTVINVFPADRSSAGSLV